MKTENSTKHIKTVAIIGMVVTAVVAIVALILKSKHSNFDGLEDLLNDDFFDDLPDIVEDEEEGLVKGSTADNFEKPEDKLGFCGLRRTYCKCVQCSEKEKNCTHCAGECTEPADAVSMHDDCVAAGYIKNNA